MKDPVIVINGLPVVNFLDSQYWIEHRLWENKCRDVRNSFKLKTSRTRTGGKTYEYTGWYRVKPGGGLESVGKEEPDFSKYYPPEPKPRYNFKFWVSASKIPKDDEQHIIIQDEDYRANSNLFKDCLVFRLEECLNRIHALYKDPEKALKVYVRKDVVLPERSGRGMGTEIDYERNEVDEDNEPSETVNGE